MDTKPILRKAVPEDAPFVAPLLVQAMDDLARFFTSNAGIESEIALFELFFTMKATQYSYENTIVAVHDEKIVGSANGYDGGKLLQLREPFFNHVKSTYNVCFPVTYDETEPGEFYIDCVSVLPEAQGKGVGTQLLKAMIEKGRQLNFKKAGLLVDIHNPNAKKLYTALGFHKAGDKSFMGGTYEHLQIDC
jgi:ribosomal protein S18 acetylase RimI-like enzyme